MNESALSLIIAIAAFAVSAITAYMTLFRRGSIRMTRPMGIYLGEDGREKRRENPNLPNHPKIHFGTILYSTAKRGHIIEGMFVSIRRGETQQTFNIWVYGEDGPLKRGSGLYVGETGFRSNHHFLLPEDGSKFAFLAGDYQLEIFATIVGIPGKTNLFTTRLLLTESIAAELLKPSAGVHFDWGADSQRYHAHTVN